MIVHLGIISVTYKLVTLLYSRRLEGRVDVLKRSLNCVLALLGMIVGTLIVCHPEWFLSEAEKVYSVNEAIGSSFWSLSACADLVGSAYVFELIVRGSNELLRWDLAVHHSATIAIIGMLRNAFAYEYAPQFYASIAACSCMLSRMFLCCSSSRFVVSLAGLASRGAFSRQHGSSSQCIRRSTFVPSFFSSQARTPFAWRL